MKNIDMVYFIPMATSYDVNYRANRQVMDKLELSGAQCTYRGLSQRLCI